MKLSYTLTMKKLQISTSGIRQGCNGSTLLFLLITSCIITFIEINTRGFCNAVCRIAVSCFAGDGLQFLYLVEDAKTAIKALATAAKECRLDINNSNSNILIYNMKDFPEEIEGIKTTNQIKYLGTVISNKRNCFNEHKDIIFKTANRYMSQTASVAAKSCNRLMIGKVFWKSASLPSMLHSTEAIFLTKEETNKLRITENKVY